MSEVTEECQEQRQPHGAQHQKVLLAWLAVAKDPSHRKQDPHGLQQDAQLPAGPQVERPLSKRFICSNSSFRNQWRWGPLRSRSNGTCSRVVRSPLLPPIAWRHTGRNASGRKFTAHRLLPCSVSSENFINSTIPKICQLVGVKSKIYPNTHTKIGFMVAFDQNGYASVCAAFPAINA